MTLDTDTPGVTDSAMPSIKVATAALDTDKPAATDNDPGSIATVIVGDADSPGTTDKTAPSTSVVEEDGAVYSKAGGEKAAVQRAIPLDTRASLTQPFKRYVSPPAPP